MVAGWLQPPGWMSERPSRRAATTDSLPRCRGLAAGWASGVADATHPASRNRFPWAEAAQLPSYHRYAMAHSHDPRPRIVRVPQGEWIKIFLRFPNLVRLPVQVAGPLAGQHLGPDMDARTVKPSDKGHCGDAFGESALPGRAASPRPPGLASSRIAQPGTQSPERER